MSDDIAACAGLVHRGDPERFRAVMAAPVAARTKLFPIYAFNVEVSRAPWVTQEPMIAEMRLQWWRDVLEEIRSGGPVRRHEVATPLAFAASGSATELDELVAARRWDIYKDPFEDETHLHRYVAQTSGNLLLAAARALGPAPEGPLRDAGFALGVANWLRAVPALEAAGRIPLVDGRPEGVRALAELGLKRLSRAHAARADIPKVVRPALLALWQTSGILKSASADPLRVAEGRLDPAPATSRLALMARAATGRW